MAQADIDDRRQAITTLLRRHTYLPVAELCRRLKISEATARRDLAALSRGKSIVRTFGGAMADYDRRFAPFADRLKVAAGGKARIAAAAMKLIRPGMTIFLDAGTTAFAVADRLRADADRPHAAGSLRVVSNSLAVIERLAGLDGIDVDLLGGRLLVKQSVFLGRETCRAARLYKFDLAFLGIEGFDTQGLWNSTGDVVALQQAVTAQSARFAIGADRTKVGVTAPAFLLPWQRVDQLITDLADAMPFSISPATLVRA